MNKKVFLFSIVILMISSFSLLTSYSIMTAYTEASSKMDPKENNPYYKPEFNIENITNVSLTNEEDKFTMQPVIINNKIKYGIELNNINSNSTFNIDIKNNGNKKGVISDIIIKGIDEYKDYVKVEVFGIKVGDIIPDGFSINNIEVSTTYTNLHENEDYTTKIELNNIEIEFVYE